MKTSSKRFIAAAACIALWSPLSMASGFTLLIYESAQDLALRSQQSERSKAYWEAYKAFGREMADAKIMRGGAPLDLPASARTVGDTGASKLQPEHAGLALGGYFQIEVESMEEALRWARKTPAVHRGGAVEVRPVIASPEM